MKKIKIFLFLLVGAFTALVATDYTIVNNPMVMWVGGVLGMLSVGIVALDGREGQTIFGSPNMDLGPVNIYLKTDIHPLEAGTVSNVSSALTGTVEVAPIVGTSTSTLIGTATTFIADLIVGQMVLIGASTQGKILRIDSNLSAIIDISATVAAGATIKKALTTVTGTTTTFLTKLNKGEGISFDGTRFGRITNIVSDTSLTIESPSVLFDSVAYRRFTAILLGGTSSTKIKYATSKAELKKSQYGESAANRVVTGETCNIEAGVVEGTAQRYDAMLQGFLSKLNSSGEYTGFGLGSALGVNDLEIKFQITVVKLYGTVESSNPLHTITFPVCAPQVEAEWSYDASTQLETKAMFNVYRSPDHVYNGQELYAYSGNLLS
jgi:hypothetical protein